MKRPRLVSEDGADRVLERGQVSRGQSPRRGRRRPSTPPPVAASGASRPRLHSRCPQLRPSSPTSLLHPTPARTGIRSGRWRERIDCEPFGPRENAPSPRAAAGGGPRHSSDCSRTLRGGGADGRPGAEAERCGGWSGASPPGLGDSGQVAPGRLPASAGCACAPRPQLVNELAEVSDERVLSRLVARSTAVPLPAARSPASCSSRC